MILGNVWLLNLFKALKKTIKHETEKMMNGTKGFAERRGDGRVAAWGDAPQGGAGRAAGRAAASGRRSVAAAPLGTPVAADRGRATPGAESAVPLPAQRPDRLAETAARLLEADHHRHSPREERRPAGAAKCHRQSWAHAERDHGMSGWITDLRSYLVFL